MSHKTYRVVLENVDLGANDDGPFRALELDTHGDTYDECWENAHVSEHDQDGGEIRNYPAADLGGTRADLVDRIILEALAEADELERERGADAREDAFREWCEERRREREPV